MNGQELFHDNLALVDRITERLCRRIGVFGADAEDLASSVRIALMENDYAILGKYEGRSALSTYLTIVIQRLVFDDLTRARGRWHASAEAQRLGPAGVMVERLVRRERRTAGEAVPIVRAAFPDLTPREIEAMIARLPERAARPRLVEIDETAHDRLPAAETADRQAVDAETRRLSSRASALVCALLAAMSLQDRMLLRLHFGSGMSIADVARMLKVPQRPLYRRLEALLAQLRRELAAAGLDAREAAGLIGDAAQELDFGLTGKNDDGLRSNVEGTT